jgi:large subunit ribosomal protein L21e
LAVHKGYRNKTRKRFKKHARDRGLGSVDKFLIDYSVGDKVDIISDSSKHKRGLPHRRYHGRTGTVIGERGRCYEIEVKLGNANRLLIVGKEHIRLNQGSLKK